VKARQLVNVTLLTTFSVQRKVNHPLFAYVGVSSHEQKLVNKIKVTALVFADNLSELIRGCLEDLLIQIFYQKGELEITVIDSPSSEKEQEIVQKFQEKYLYIIDQRTDKLEQQKNNQLCKN